MTNDPSRTPPPDPPVPPTTNPSAVPASASHTPLRSPTDGAHTGTTPAAEVRRRRIGKVALASTIAALSDRDHAVLQSIRTHRFLTSKHITTLHFHDHASASAGARAARSVLERLRKYRLVATLDRRVGGIYGGSSTPTYYLDAAGIRVTDGAASSKRRRHEPSKTFVRHTLAIADTAVELVSAERGGELELISVDPEPSCWRSYPGLGGGTVTLKPDLHAVTTPGAGSEYEDSWFIEIDLGTETIPTLIRKCREYEAYRRSGTEQSQTGVFPIVIWVMSSARSETTARRIDSLSSQIQRSHDLTSDVYRIITPDQLIPLITKGGIS